MRRTTGPHRFAATSLVLAPVLVPVLVPVLAAVLSTAAHAQDFPAGTVSVAVTSTASCAHILAPGAISGATASLNGGDLKISLPVSGPIIVAGELKVLSIPVGSTGSTTAVVTGTEALSGPATASVTLDNGVPTAFTVTTGNLTGACTAMFTASGAVSAGATSNDRKPSSEVVRNEVVLSRTTQGVFLDATRAVSQGLNALNGLGGPNALSLAPGTLGFSTRGIAAGSHSLPFAVWGSAAYTMSENDGATTATESDRVHVTLGADVALHEKFLVGIAAGYELDDTDTAFNGGNIETDGFTLVGYAGAVLTDALSADVAVGRSDLESDQFRTATGTRITSSLDSDRLFAAANLNYGHQVNQWLLTGRAGMLWAKDDQDAFTESDGTAVASSKFRVARLKLGGEVARSFGALEPFISATYNYSFSQTDATAGSPKIDRSDLLLGIGARYLGSGNLSGALEFNTLLGRDDVEEHSLSVLIRANF